MDADFGIPGLGFYSQGNLEAYFDYSMYTGLQVTSNGDIFLKLSTDTDDSDEVQGTGINASFTTALSDDFELGGGLGALQLQGRNKESSNPNIGRSTGIFADFNLNFIDPDDDNDGLLPVQYLWDSDLNLSDLVELEVDGEAALSFGITTGIDGSGNDTSQFPSFSFDLGSQLPLFNYSNQEQTTGNEDESGLDLTYTGILNNNVNAISLSFDDALATEQFSIQKDDTLELRLDPNETLQLSNFGTDQSGQITAELSLKPGLRDSVSIPSGFELTFANGNNDDEIVLRPTTRLTVAKPREFHFKYND